MQVSLLLCCSLTIFDFFFWKMCLRSQPFMEEENYLWCNSSIVKNYATQYCISADFNPNSPVHATHNSSFHIHTSQTPSSHIHTSFLLVTTSTCPLSTKTPSTLPKSQTTTSTNPCPQDLNNTHLAMVIALEKTATMVDSGSRGRNAVAIED